MNSANFENNKTMILDDEPTWEELNIFDANQGGQEFEEIVISSKKYRLLNSKILLSVGAILLGVASYFAFPEFSLTDSSETTINTPIVTTHESLSPKIEQQQEVKEVSELPGSSSTFSRFPEVALPLMNETSVVIKEKKIQAARHKQKYAKNIRVPVEKGESATTEDVPVVTVTKLNF
jgi:hypothetical protein